MVIHVLGDVPQHQAGDDGHAAEGNAAVVDPRVAVGVRQLARQHDLVPEGDVSTDEGQDILRQAGACEDGSLGDLGHVVDLVVDKDAGDVQRQHGDELLVENIVVDGVSDGTADDADGERQGRDGGDKIIWADNGGKDAL